MQKSSFREWLTEQTSNAPSEQERQQKLNEWLLALESLYDQMYTWLRQDDPGEVIKTWTDSKPIEEEELGVYSAPLLRFVLKGHMVNAQPIARNVIGPATWGGSLTHLRGEGRVDLTSGLGRIHLYRVRDSGENPRWGIVNQDQLTFKELDKDTFLAALRRLFS